MTQAAHSGCVTTDISTAERLWGALLLPPSTTNCALSSWRLGQLAGVGPLGRLLPQRSSAKLSLGRHWQSICPNASWLVDLVSRGTQHTWPHRWWALDLLRAFSTVLPSLTLSAEQGAVSPKRVLKPSSGIT